MLIFRFRLLLDTYPSLSTWTEGGLEGGQRVPLSTVITEQEEWGGGVWRLKECLINGRTTLF